MCLDCGSGECRDFSLRNYGGCIGCPLEGAKKVRAQNVYRSQGLIPLNSRGLSQEVEKRATHQPESMKGTR